jgi:hypothetical protein
MNHAVVAPISGSHHLLGDAELRNLTIEIHALGERSLYELFRELHDGAELASALRRYGDLYPLAPFIAHMGGRDLEPRGQRHA